MFQHYKKSLHDSFEEHPNANYLIILEEDLDVSADILSYFKQLLPVFENDESVYCISAWNDQVGHWLRMHEKIVISPAGCHCDMKIMAVRYIVFH